MENITVLVVDNDRAANRTLHDGLSDVGFNVLTTNTELDGLDDLQYGTNIDVVLLDYNIPTLDDSQTLEQLNNQFPNVKAIGITPRNTPRLAQTYRQGVEKLLPTPISLADLVAAIHSVAPRTAAQSRRSFSEGGWTRLTISTTLFLISAYSILKFFSLLINMALVLN